MNRKVALLIVEGGSDAAALTVPFRNYLRKSEAGCVFECAVYKTDITLHNYDDQYTIGDPYCVENRVVEAVKEYLSSEYNSNKYHLEDIGIAMTLSDLDACYCKDDDLLFGGLECKTTINLLNKKLICNDINYMKDRNVRKTTALGILSTTTVLAINNHHIPFRAFYCSINLEHALYNDLSIVSFEDKMNAARKWASKHKGDHELFYQSIQSIPLLSNEYDKTWDEKLLRNNPFGRYSNILLMIHWVVDESKKYLTNIKDD